MVVLLFRGEYPRSIFDFVLGLNRWVLRVGAYAALMTAEYPPFRLDGGESEPGGITLEPTPHTDRAGNADRPTVSASWGAGRVIAVVVASLAVLAGLAALAGGGIALVFDQTQRDAGGYLMTGSTAYSTDTYALVSDSYRTGAAGDAFVARDMLGTVRIRTHSTQPRIRGHRPGRRRRLVPRRRPPRGRDPLRRAQLRLHALTTAARPPLRRPPSTSGSRRRSALARRRSPGRPRTATGGSLS